MVSEFWRTWYKDGWEMSLPTTMCLLTTRSFTSTGSATSLLIFQTFVFVGMTWFCLSLSISTVVCLVLPPSTLLYDLLLSIYHCCCVTYFCHHLPPSALLCDLLLSPSPSISTIVWPTSVTISLHQHYCVTYFCHHLPPSALLCDLLLSPSPSISTVVWPTSVTISFHQHCCVT